MVDFDPHAQLSRRGLHHMRDFHDRKLFRKLIEDPAFPAPSGVLACDLDAPYRIAQIQEAARLPALSIHGERMSHGSLDAKTIQDGPEDFVVIEAIDQS